MPVLQPSRFYPFPTGLDTSKVVRGLDIWQTFLALYI